MEGIDENKDHHAATSSPIASIHLFIYIVAEHLYKSSQIVS